jgi:hypothetical protein
VIPAVYYRSEILLLFLLSASRPFDDCLGAFLIAGEEIRRDILSSLRLVYQIPGAILIVFKTIGLLEHLSSARHVLHLLIEKNTGFEQFTLHFPDPLSPDIRKAPMNRSADKIHPLQYLSRVFIIFSSYGENPLGR